MSNICAIHQPNFLPWTGYFHKMAKADVFVFLDNVDIVTGSSTAITHRTRILSPQGPLWLSVPLEKGRSKHINLYRIKEAPWREKMLKTVQQFYAKAPNFNEVYALFKNCLQFDLNDLASFNIHGIKTIANYLGIHTRMIRASELPVQSADRSQRIVDICLVLKANSYISGKGGLGYHDVVVFETSGVQILHRPFVHPKYIQQHNTPFEQGLSIFDVLFNIDQPKALFSENQQ